MSILCEGVVSWCGAIAAKVVGAVPIMKKCLESRIVCLADELSQRKLWCVCM